MNDFTLDELKVLVSLFEQSDLAESNATAADLKARVLTAHAEREELENMDFDDCIGGACKL